MLRLALLVGMVLPLVVRGEYRGPGFAEAASRPANQATPLAQAVKAFNDGALRHPDGMAQPPLTEDEVVAAIRFWRPEKDSPVSEELLKTFKRIAETRKLPGTAEFEHLAGCTPGDGYTYEVWWVRLALKRPDGSSYAFPIREQMIRCRPYPDTQTAGGEASSRFTEKDFIRILKARIDELGRQLRRMEARLAELEAL